MAISPCNSDPSEVLEAITGIKAAEASFEATLSGAADAALGNAEKFDKFVNGGVTEEVQLGNGQPTPTLRNTVHLVKSAAATLDGSDVSGKFSDAANGGAELRMLADRFGDIVNVKDFGAAGDGGASASSQTDDTPVLFIGAGTSAMQGYAETTSGGSISVEGAQYWDYGLNQWQTPVRDPMWSGGMGSAVPAMVQALKTAFPGRTILFVNGGDGGSSIIDEDYRRRDGNWSRLGWSMPRLYNIVGNALASWTATDKVLIGGIVWWGGTVEGGMIANGTITVSEYKADFSDILQRLHDTYGCRVFLIGQCRHPDTRTSNPALWSAQGEIINAQYEVVQENDWAFLACTTTGYESNASAYTGSEGSHLGQAANNAIGTETGEYIASHISLPQTKTVLSTVGTDDASAFSSFNAASGEMKYIPKGAYRIGTDVRVWNHGRIGNGVENDASAFLLSIMDHDKNCGPFLSIGETKTEAAPMMVLSSNIECEQPVLGKAPVYPVGIYAEHRQTGNGNVHTHSIFGRAVNAGTGYNGTLGVAGIAVKEANAGAGYICGVFASAEQNSSRNTGRAVGMEAHINQNVPGTGPDTLFPGALYPGAAWSSACRLYSGGVGDAATNGLMIDAGKYGFWNAIAIDPSCFATRDGGRGVEGTTAINGGGWGLDGRPYPETGMYLGYTRDVISMRDPCSCNIKAYNTQLHQQGEVHLNIISEETSSGNNGSMKICFYTRDNPIDNNYVSMTNIRAGTNGRIWLDSFYKNGIGSVNKFGVEMGGSDIITEWFCPQTTGSMRLGTPAAQWNAVYASTGSIQTSDERLKTNIDAPSDALMNAWSKIRFKVFQMRDAVAMKGENAARIHIGVIAQDVRNAFESEGLDAERYGLFCYDSWDEDFEDIEVVDAEAVIGDDGRVITPRQSHIEHRLVREAGDKYSIRYDEALALECAYQRWRLEQIEDRLNGGQ